MARKRKRIQTKTKRSSFKALLNLLVILSLFSGLLAGVWFYYRKDEVNVKKQRLHDSMPEGFTSFGIDVSHHQGAINWDDILFTYDLDSLITFVYCKATEGTDHIDTQWDKNRKQLLELEKPHGAYHFFSVETDPALQARHFLSQWKHTDTDLPPVLDVEVQAKTDEELIRSMKMWLDIVEKESGMRPIIYTSLSFYETKFLNHFRDHYFWVAAYSRRPDCLADERILHWQYSDSGELPGIDKRVDLNVSKIDFN